VARGFWMTQWNKTASAAAKKAMLTELFGLAKAGQLKSYVERHELDNFADAFKRVQEGQVSRKVLLTLNKK
jgi:D-arabinose 1-dehydrogenase-like Zn-dependent alcohol dehydrogenase